MHYFNQVKQSMSDAARHSATSSLEESPVLSSLANRLVCELRESQSGMNDAIVRLEMRLSDVLSQAQPPPCETKCDAPAPCSSPLCDELDRLIASENAARIQIQSLINRLTV